MPRRGILQTVKRYVLSCVTVNNNVLKFYFINMQIVFQLQNKNYVVKLTKYKIY